MSKEIYHGKGSSSDFMEKYAISLIWFALWFFGTAYFISPVSNLLPSNNSTFQAAFLPAYSNYTVLGIPLKILYIAFYIGLIAVFLFFIGSRKRVAFYVDEGVFLKNKTWGLFSREEKFKITDVDSISVSQESLVGKRTGRIFSSSNTISLVMKGIEIKVVPIFIAKKPEVAMKLAEEISKETGIPLK